MTACFPDNGFDWEFVRRLKPAAFSTGLWWYSPNLVYYYFISAFSHQIGACVCGSTLGLRRHLWTMWSAQSLLSHYACHRICWDTRNVHIASILWMLLLAWSIYLVISISYFSLYWSFPNCRCDAQRSSAFAPSSSPASCKLHTSKS